MGFNRRYLPELSVLLERRKKYESDEDFLWDVVGKSDAILGPHESVAYLDSIYNKVMEERKLKREEEEAEKNNE